MKKITIKFEDKKNEFQFACRDNEVDTQRLECGNRAKAAGRVMIPTVEDVGEFALICRDMAEPDRCHYQVVFELPGRTHLLELSIYPQSPGLGDPTTGFEVNWCALGAQSPDTAKLFARALLFAAEQAEALTTKWVTK